MRTTRNILLLAAVALFALPVLANDAGCGLGSLIIQKDTKLSQSLAVTTNGTFLSQLFGITSGTSNCTSSGLVMRSKEAQMYAEANMPSLRIEMARGHGENLVAFGQTLGCEKSTMNAFGRMTRSKYDMIFKDGDSGADQVVSNVEKAISADPELKNGCHI